VKRFDIDFIIDLDTKTATRRHCKQICHLIDLIDRKGIAALGWGLILPMTWRSQEKCGSWKKLGEIAYEESSGNVFSDMGLENADELFAHGQIGIQVLKILEKRKLKRSEIATFLGIAQPDVSHLMNGHCQRFSKDNLFDSLKRLDQKVTIQIVPRRPEEPYQEKSVLFHEGVRMKAERR
jgi:predicted XRE-type DNA-binding protein